MKKLNHTFKEIESLEEFLDIGWTFVRCCFQGIDFTQISINWERIHLEDCTFLGCKIDQNDHIKLIKKGSILFPGLPDLPYQAYRKSLYNWRELYEPSKNNGNITTDEAIYNHFSAFRFKDSITEALYQRIHDHSIDDALYDLLGSRYDGSFNKKAVGIMGGHGTLRNDLNYKAIAHLSFQLSKKGYLIASGGGPGIMEAANLGAYMADYSLMELELALDIISSDLKFSNPNYLLASHEVLAKFPYGKESLAIPTWFYGHEPSNLFASHIAKYFSNSIREDNLLAIALHGIVFAPGSAGTNQEIFMDLSQNHYKTYGSYSPMVFFNKKHYIDDTNIYPTIKNLAKGTAYNKMLYIEDDIYEIAAFIQNNPPFS